MINKSHPGFNDKEYIARRNIIAEYSNTYRSGDEIPTIQYIQKENDVWKNILCRISSVHKEKACKNYLKAYDKICLNKESVPQLSDISSAIQKEYNFTLSPAYELVPAKKFLNALASNVMLCTQYIRHHSVPDYTPEPDIIHEILGHAVFFMDKDYCYINNLFGKASLNASEEDIIKLMRLYWYTIEFGLCYEEDKLKTYGAGLLSSIGELSNIDNIPKEEFNISKIIKTDFETTQYQDVLFYSNSFNEALTSIENYLFTFIKS